MEKVVVGLSGGIDSFVTALLLQQQGYEVIGVNLSLWGENELSEVEHLCEKLNIPLLCKDGHELFTKAVVQPFMKAYLSGFTPSPCCTCNRYVKWKLLQEVADEQQAKHIATGHYVRICCISEKYYIRQGVDSSKDQSYFLWGVPQDILSRALTPLGSYTKAEVRTWAVRNGYARMAAKRESMGICFLQGSDYRDFILQYTGSPQTRGEIVDRAGNLIGEHSGLLNYTVGQKRGMPVVGGQSLYVAAMDAEHNRIVGDVKAGLYSDTLWVEQAEAADWQDLDASDVKVRVRGLGLNPQGFVRIEKLPDNNLLVQLSDPAWVVAPGQPVTFYRGDVVVGGGWLKAGKIK